MRVNEFLAECRTQWSQFDDAREHSRDRYLPGLPRKIQGMATENKLILLNLSAKYLVRDEVYGDRCWFASNLDRSDVM